MASLNTNFQLPSSNFPSCLDLLKKSKTTYNRNTIFTTNELDNLDDLIHRLRNPKTNTPTLTSLERIAYHFGQAKQIHYLYSTTPNDINENLFTTVENILNSIDKVFGNIEEKQEAKEHLLQILLKWVKSDVFLSSQTHKKDLEWILDKLNEVKDSSHILCILKKLNTALEMKEAKSHTINSFKEKKEKAESVLKKYEMYDESIHTTISVKKVAEIISPD